MKKAICAIVLAVGATSPALSDPTITATTPVAGDPFRDFRIEGCEGTLALASFRYQRNDFIDALEMSDICLDEETGELLSIEPVEGLTLVEKTNNARAFEIISSGEGRYDRVRFDVMNEIFSPACAPEIIGANGVSLTVPHGEKISAHGDAFAIFAQGHTITPHSPTPLAASADGVYLAIRPLSIIDVDEDPYFFELNADAFGEISFTGQTGTVVIDQGDDNWVGQAEGQINLTLEDNGTIFGEGSFAFANRRIAGLHPKDWVSMSGEIPYLRGYFMGENGELLNTYGLATATYTDASGDKGTFRAQVFMFKCFLDAN